MFQTISAKSRLQEALIMITCSDFVRDESFFIEYKLLKDKKFIWTIQLTLT